MRSRADRWQEVLKQRNKIDFEIVRIFAVEHDLIDAKTEVFATLPIISIWKSHQTAMQHFLKSKDSHAIILEDDFNLSDNLNLLLKQINLSEDMDFVQLGYLYTSPVQYFSVKTMNFINSILRLLGLLAKLNFIGARFLQDKKLIQDNKNLPFILVPNDIRAGAHAYVISRRFALASQCFNSPVHLSTDGLYMALGWTRTFRMYRMRKNFIKQSKLFSSVTDRTLN
jgi:GR25 family glycosyltransferase involved in LPS biosynthesis